MAGFRRIFLLKRLSKHRSAAKGGELKKGARVNLEQPLTAGKEFGGHFVLGHVDTVGRVTHLTF